MSMVDDLLRGDQCKNAQGTARAILDLERSSDNHRALRWKLIEIRQALQTVTVGTVH